MPTWLTSVRNQFRSPSGSPNEAPDGPGAFQALRDDVDNYIGVGGAEYSAGSVNSIPSGRRFPGKLAYYAPTDTVYRYVGAGNTSLGANAASSAWQAWSKPAAAFAPQLTNLSQTGTPAALWGISEGLLWISLWTTISAIGSTTADVVLTSPAAFVGALGSGSGQYQKGGNTSNGNQIELTCFGIGTPGASNGSLRVRARAVSGTAVAANILGSVITWTSGDTMELNYTGPCALVA